MLSSIDAGVAGRVADGVGLSAVGVVDAGEADEAIGVPVVVCNRDRIAPSNSRMSDHSWLGASGGWQSPTRLLLRERHKSTYV